MSILRPGSRWPVLLALTALIVGCGGSDGNRTPEEVVRAPSAPAVESPPVATATEERKRVLFLGTSLTAAFGLDESQGYPAAIQAKIDSAGLPFEVVNAGLSGETSAGALRRIPWLLREPFDVLVLETGANDMLRGQDLDALRANLQAIVDTVRAVRPEARIVLAGMLAAPNLGAEYGRDFARLYPEVARANDLALVPFLLEGVGGVPELNLPDGIHPNAAGQKVVAANVWETLAPVLREEAAEGDG